MNNNNLKNKLLYEIYNNKKLLELIDEYDIFEFQARWRKYYCSKKVSSIVNEVEFNKSCGCCSDAIVYASPFIKISDMNIYDDPCQIPIGETIDYGGISPSKIDNFHKLELINNKIKQYLLDNPVIEDKD